MKITDIDVIQIHFIHFEGGGIGNVLACGTAEGAIRGIGFQVWQEDGTKELRRVRERLGREGPFAEERER